MHPPSRLALAAAGAAVALLALPAEVGAAGAVPLPGRYRGQTGDGHVFELTVERSRKKGFERKVTHLYLVYDIAGCRSGPIRQVFFASVRTGGSGATRGRFSRDVNASGAANKAQLSLRGRFTSATRVSGTFRVGVGGRCPIDAGSPTLTFAARRR